jgi:Flp pilus assembly pilin Flp
MNMGKSARLWGPPDAEGAAMARWRHDENGANAVEFALVLPVLLMLVFGGITGGWLYNQQQQLTHAAREGARYGATLEGAGEQGECTQSDFDQEGSWCRGVRDRVITAMAGMFDVSNIDRVALDGDEVIVRLTHVGELNIIFVAWQPELSAESIARYERAED